MIGRVRESRNPKKVIRVALMESYGEIRRVPVNLYRIDNLHEGYVDLSFVVKTISQLVYKTAFWEEMISVMNEFKHEKDIKQFLLRMAKDYVKVLDPETKKKCIEILSALR